MSIAVSHSVDVAPGLSADAPTVVLSNSLGTTRAMWDKQVPALSSAFRVVRYDTRGHGDSQVPSGPSTVDDLADDVVALLDRLGLERVHFVGLSLGGMTGMRLAARNPERVDRLVVLCTSARLEPAQSLARPRSDGACGGYVGRRHDRGRTLVHAVLPRAVPGPLRGRPGHRVHGREMVLEESIVTDVALVRAAVADRHGNAVFHASARNFNPAAAMSGRLTIVEAETVVELGEIGPDDVHLPGVFVQRVVPLTPEEAQRKDVEKRTVRQRGATAAKGGHDVVDA